MGEIRAKMKWTGGLRFEGDTAFGQKIATDASIKAGGNEDGYKPTQLLLFGIAGCTGIDIMRILKKQRQELTSMEIELVGYHQDEYPKPMHTIEVKYIATGKNLDEKKLAQAIELSNEKYCMVGQTVEIPGKVVTSFEIKSE
jgi:putative redox protein